MTASGRNEKDRGTMERMGRSVGGLAGRAADAAADIGGSMIRGAAEVLGGWWAEGGTEAARSWDEAQERRSREHFERSTTTSAYDEALPYYRLGHTARQNPEYASRGFDDVEPELRRVAEEGEGGSRGEWPNVRGYVQFGYEQGEGRQESR